MKLIFHFALFWFYYGVIDSALISDLHDGLVAYFKASNDPAEYDPLDNSHYLNDDPHNHDNDFSENTRTHQSKFNAKDDIDDDYDLVKQMKKNDEWGKKYLFYNDEVNPKQALEDEGERQVISNGLNGNAKDIEKARKKTLLLRQYKKKDLGCGIATITPSPLNTISKISQYFFKDPVLNSLRRRPNHIAQNFKHKKIDFRRKSAKKDSTSSSSSSSRELKDFKDEFREQWLHKKFEALNQTTKNRGDVVNMVAARPWGVPCGDPNQHDMPWGVCMLAAECEAEFRIYRGDLFCGRTQFICCGLQLTTYDTYQGFDVSFDDKSLSTDSEEKRDREKTSKERGKKKKTSDRKKRRSDRNKRKKKIKKHIKKIVKEIRKILNKQYRNGTKQRKKRTKQLKKFIKDLKKQYKKDRQSVKDMHANEMMLIDKALMERLKQIQKMNKHFVENATFREIVVKGTITKKSARMLLEAYPELEEFLEARRADGAGTRRAGGGGFSQESDDNVLEYDVEYGYLYY